MHVPADGAVFRAATGWLIDADSLPLILDAVRIWARLSPAAEPRLLAANGFARGAVAVTRQQSQGRYNPPQFAHLDRL